MSVSHYESRASYYADPDGDALHPECGSWSDGDTIEGYAAPERVTCGKCRLTPAWIDAAKDPG